MSSQELMVLNQGHPVEIQIERVVNGIQMGVLVDGTPYISQPSLADLCGVSQATIESISLQWNEKPLQPRIVKIKESLAEVGFAAPTTPHVTARWKGKERVCYPTNICISIIRYYAVEAGPNCQAKARESFWWLVKSALQDLSPKSTGNDSQNRSATPPPRRWS